MKSVDPLDAELVSETHRDAVGLESFGGGAGFLRSLLLTIAIELAVAAVLLRRFDLRLVLTLVGVNLLTQPALTLLLVNGPLTEPVGEALVMLVEWPIERGVLRLTWRRALEVSVAANLTSWGIGFFL